MPGISGKGYDFNEFPSNPPNSQNINGNILQYQHINQNIESYNSYPNQTSYSQNEIFGNPNNPSFSNNISPANTVYSQTNSLNQYAHIDSNYINSMLPHKNKHGYNRPINLFQYSHIFPYEAEKPQLPPIPENLEPFACQTEFIRCSMNIAPQTRSLFKKLRLPFGLLMNPFNDKQKLRYLSKNKHQLHNEIPLVTDQVMARCKVCRTYINPFVILLDNRHWKCNICFRTNELPEEYYFDQSTRQYIQPYKRAELRNAAIEFVASSDYMIRPPQPAVYIFVFEVSIQACKTDYIKSFCEVLNACLDEIPGDTRTQIGFISFDKCIHFYRFNTTAVLEDKDLAPDGGVADIITCPDVEEPFIPCEENLLFNLSENKELIKSFLLRQLPNTWCKASSLEYNDDNASPNLFLRRDVDLNAGNCLGPALLSAYKLIARTGGRISAFLHTMPNTGQGRLDEVNGDGSSTNSNGDSDGTSVTVLPKSDFYKRLALDMSNDQVCTDFFFFTQSYIDIATLATLPKYSAGSMHYFPAYHDGIDVNPLQEERFEQAFKRYLTRDIGFEAVLRVRCTKGIVPKGFFGNFFLRSSNLLCLPTVKPDTSFAVHLDIEDDLIDTSLVSIQTAILYTTSKGERRIRVLTFTLPVSNNFDDIINNTDQEVIISLISIMASERCLNTNLHSAREAMITACQDFLEAFNNHSYMTVTYSNLMCPENLSFIPIRIHALLKNVAFKISENRSFNRTKSIRGSGTQQQYTKYFSEIDERAFALYVLQTKPIESLLTDIYPQLYNVNYLSSDDIKESTNEISKFCSYIPIFELSYKQLDERCSYLLDLGENCLLFMIHRYTPISIIKDLFGDSYTGQSFEELNDEECEISPNSKIAGFLECLQNEKPYYVPILVVKDENNVRNEFKCFMYDDRTESSMSLHEFLLYIVKEIIS